MAHPKLSLNKSGETSNANTQKKEMKGNPLEKNRESKDKDGIQNMGRMLVQN